IAGAVLVQSEDRAGAIFAAVKGGAVKPAIAGFEQLPGILPFVGRGAEVVKDAIRSSILLQHEDGAIATAAAIARRTIQESVSACDRSGIGFLSVVVDAAEGVHATIFIPGGPDSKKRAGPPVIAIIGFGAVEQPTLRA